ncbi:ferredoxin [Streptosporangium sp. DT93]|uniref:ferredoxin n=1 Tax=Streptosporangium sp. DT93 TaxID=3393428 RepID=UPI003CEBCDB4
MSVTPAGGGPGEGDTGHRAAAGPVRVILDADLCQGHAECELAAPAVFSVPRRGAVDVLVAEPPAALAGAVREAVRNCPTRALRLEE